MKSNIQSLLVKIIHLLSVNGEKKWAETFEQLSKKLDVDYDTTLIEIKRTFGGAGSFNDIVLHQNGQMLTRENRELDKLQDQLYDATIAEIVRSKSH
ncbi:DUF6966 domain-containing protein [Enterobacter wuhouensis]|uniref:DUF6966 domain-containing protein n=1 Tax=Enterobacter wuhouensis TaxID=2529381 RepID=UPI0035244E3E